MKVVCDTNIIIDFAKIHRLDLLKGTFKEVLIPPEVKEELLAGDGEEQSDITKAIDAWIIVKSVQDIFAVENLEIHLDKGESACMVLFKEIKADLLAVNDLKARGTAHAMGIKIIGTLGILQLAKGKGLVEEVQPLLDKLIKIGSYISKGLYNRILKDAGEI